jgi:hypothetical protein
VEETRYGNTLSEAHDFAQHIDQRYDSTKCMAVVESTANMWITLIFLNVSAVNDKEFQRIFPFLSYLYGYE